MPNIETYYLVDFENVNDAGLACSNQAKTKKKQKAQKKYPN